VKLPQTRRSWQDLGKWKSAIFSECTQFLLDHSSHGENPMKFGCLNV